MSLKRVVPHSHPSEIFIKLSPSLGNVTTALHFNAHLSFFHEVVLMSGGIPLLVYAQF